MYEIFATETFDAPIERVFDVVSDHEGFFVGPRFDECTLEVEGTKDRNGVGALRRIRTAGLTFREEILRFERPHRYDYVIRTLVNAKGRSQPVDHELGWLEFSETDGGTRIEWRSRFRFTVPVVGWLLERAAGPRVARNFVQLLRATKQRIEGS